MQFDFEINTVKMDDCNCPVKKLDTIHERMDGSI